MKILLFGATGMVGQGILRECLLDPDVESVLAVGRRASGATYAKLRELVAPNLHDLSPHAAEPHRIEQQPDAIAHQDDRCAAM